jgi:hypothetical protein
MVNVWAYRVGQFTSQGGEWDHSVNFDTLPDIVDRLNKAKIAKGQVKKLAIVAHGDSGGLVQLQEGNLTAETAGNFSKDLQAIRDYLWVNARLIFYSCIAAQGKGGSKLLNTLSGAHFPGRHVIGFERFGVISTTPPVEAPGQMRCSLSNLKFSGPNPVAYCSPTATLKPVSDPKRLTEQFLSEYSIYAKWSYNGQIIKLPHDEITTKKVLEEAKVICGPKAVELALKDPRQRAEIDYIAIKTTNPSPDIQRLFTLVQQAPYNFKWGKPEWRLRELDLTKLPRPSGKAAPPRHEVIVAVTKEKYVNKYRCAWGHCPGHEQVKDYCEHGVAHIPNNPLR